MKDLIPKNLEHFEEFLLPLLLSLGALMLVWLLRQIAFQIINRNVIDPFQRVNIMRRVNRFLTFLTIVLLMGAWLRRLSEILWVISLFGAGLAIVNREVILSMVAWMHIITRQPFVVGDRIEINEVSGDVIDIKLLWTTLMETRGWVEADQSTGRIMRIPNNWIFNYAIQNYTAGFEYIWNEFSVTVSADSDWNLARDTMMALAQESSAIVEHQVKSQLKTMSQEYLVYYSALTPFVYVKISDKGVRLTLRYLCKARNRRGSEHAIMTGVLEEFAQHPDVKLVF